MKIDPRVLIQNTIWRIAGIAVCGVGVGGLLIPPMVRLFLQEYGWRGTLLLIAGLRTHLFIAGSLFRPLTKQAKPRNSSLILKFDPGSRLNLSCHKPMDEQSRNASEASIDDHVLRPNGSIRTIQVNLLKYNKFMWLVHCLLWPWPAILYFKRY